MFFTITGKPQVTIHPGRESPGTGYHQFVQSTYEAITARDLSDNKIKFWEKNRYDFSYVDTFTTGGLNSAGSTPTRMVVNGSGSIGVGAISVTVKNVGGSNGNLMGGALVTGSSNTITAEAGNVIDTEIAYDATGTSYEIIIVR